MKEWYYKLGSQQIGPIHASELKNLLRGKEISTNTLVWRNGMDSWMSASAVPEFLEACPTAARSDYSRPIDHPDTANSNDDREQEITQQDSPLTALLSRRCPASPTERLLAGFFDTMICGLLGFPLMLFMVNNVSIILTLFACMLVVVPCVYFGLTESSKVRASIGKRLVGIEVLDIHGNKLSFMRATLRQFIKQSSLLVVYIPVYALFAGLASFIGSFDVYGPNHGLVLSAFFTAAICVVAFAAGNPRKQALHDILTNCIVLLADNKTSYQKAPNAPNQ